VINFCLLGFEIAMHGFNSFELIGLYVKLEILYQGYYSFLKSVSKAWHTCKARLLGVRPLSHVELMLWVWGVTFSLFTLCESYTFMEYGIRKYSWSWKPRKHFPSQFHRHSIATYTCKTCKLTLGKYKSRVRLGFSIYINLTFDSL
jgi:hypothetical protein